jgi:hypothetical protein
MFSISSSFTSSRPPIYRCSAAFRYAFPRRQIHTQFGQIIIYLERSIGWSLLRAKMPKLAFTMVCIIYVNTLNVNSGCPGAQGFEIFFFGVGIGSRADRHSSTAKSYGGTEY